VAREDAILRAYKDPEEAPLLSRAADDPRDVEARRAYRALLASRGDPRARLFELAEAIEGATEAAPIAAEMDALLADLGVHDWWRTVSGMAPVRNCGRAKAEDVYTRFTFVCPRTWVSLGRTKDEDVRSCDGCGELVYFCADDDALKRHAQQGHCVAMPATAEEDAGTRARRESTWVGRPRHEDYLSSYALRGAE
jgi:hypothetical protein